MTRKHRASFIALTRLLQRRYPELKNPTKAVVDGRVVVDGRTISNPKARVREDAILRVIGPRRLRGRAKLAAALDAFGLDVKGVVAVDVGAAAGGFTSALLDQGAKRIYAVDAGFGQLVGRLRLDSRVTNLERTNVAALDDRVVPEVVDLVTLDLSYLSVADAVGSLLRLRLAPQARLIALIKPTFELRANSLVTDPGEVRNAIRIAVEAIESSGWQAEACTIPAVTGAGGAIEAFVLARRQRRTEDQPVRVGHHDEAGSPAAPLRANCPPLVGLALPVASRRSLTTAAMADGRAPFLATPHGFGNDARSRFLRRRPPEAALRWVENELGARVEHVRACRGGSSSSIHLVRLSRGTSALTVVLRRYVIKELNDEEPDIAEREAHVLRLLQRCEIPTPEVLAVDPAGEQAGTPAVVMTRLPGRVEWSPIDIEPWLHQLAELLPHLHATPIATTDGVQPFRPYEPESWDPPPWMRNPGLWDQALEVFHGPRLDPDKVFIHRDYHPGNVLWRRGRVAGLIDWQAASVGPRTVDVVHCRGNLLSRFGVEAADRFLAIWQHMTGCDYHPWAEIVMLVDAFEWNTRHTQGPSHLHVLETLLECRLAELRP